MADGNQQNLKMAEEEQMKREVCQWLKETLELDITPQTFFETLDTGVVLCQLVDKIQEKVKTLEEAGEQVHCKIPLDPISYHADAQKNNFRAQENIKHFISWCRRLGVPNGCIFDTDDLVQHKQERTILLCLLDVSHYDKKLSSKPLDSHTITKQEALVTSKKEQIEKEVKELEGNMAAVSHSNSESIEPNAASLPLESKLSQNEPPTAHVQDPQPLDHDTNPPVNKPPSDDQKAEADCDDSEDTSYSPFQDYCSYPFLFSLLLLLLLLGGGLFLRRTKQ